jgi:hypothetical protein
MSFWAATSTGSQTFIHDSIHIGISSNRPLRVDSSGVV